MAVTQTEIKFQPNLPVVIRLDRNPSEAREFPSKFEHAEPRYRHTCDDNAHFFYLPTTAQRHLLKSLAEAGDTVRITKSVAGDSTTWGVVVLADTAEPAPAPAPQPGPRMVQRTSGGNALAAQPAPPPPARSGNSHLAQCLYAAVDAAIEASEYARSKNFSVTFLGSDIRAMAASLFINDNQGGRS